MNTSDFQREIRRWWRDYPIELSVWSNFRKVGIHYSLRSGEGLHHKRSREYESGDPADAIDWLETSETGILTVEEVREQRVVPVRIIIDLRSGMWMGTGDFEKRETALLIASSIGRSATAVGDPVTLDVIAPRGAFVATSRCGVDVMEDLERVHRIPAFDVDLLSKRVGGVLQTDGEATIVIMLSDFTPPLFFRELLRRMEPQNYLFPIVVLDRIESLDRDGCWGMPPVGQMNVRDPLSGVAIEIDTQSKRLRSEVETVLRKRDDDLRRLFRRNGASFSIVTNPREAPRVLRRVLSSLTLQHLPR